MTNEYVNSAVTYCFGRSNNLLSNDNFVPQTREDGESNAALRGGGVLDVR